MGSTKVLLNITSEDSLQEAIQALKQQPRQTEIKHIELWINVSQPGLMESSVEFLIEALHREAASGLIRIEEVRFRGGIYHRDGVDQNTVIRLCNAMAVQPHLETLHCSGGRSGMQYLAPFLSQAKHIRKCSCFFSIFEGNQQDFSDFAQALHSHPSLPEINFVRCEIPTEQRTNHNITAVLTALSTIPNLTGLQLSGFVPPESETEPNPGLLALICNSNLQKFTLSIRDPVSSHSIISATSIPLCTSQTIRQLSLQTDLSHECMLQLSNIVKENRTLEKLRVGVFRFDSDGPFTLLIDALAENSTLLEVCFRTCCWYKTPFSPGIQDAFVSLIATKNFTIHKLQFSHDPTNGRLDLVSSHTEKLIRLYTKLNRMGRKQVWQNTAATKKDWVDMLVAAEGEPRVIHSLLSKNPSVLFCTACGGETSATAVLGRPLGDNGV